MKMFDISPQYDPWDPIRSLRQYGKHQLTSVEMTVTHLCNMRCEHCAVGDALTMSEGAKLPLSMMLRRLDEVEHLETISITGGEPSFHKQTVDEYILPLLKYARERGVRSQINSNLTLDLSRYEQLAPYLDVMHISYNYLNGDDFYEIGFANSERKTSRKAAYRLYEQMMNNALSLSQSGLFVSAESMLNQRTHQQIGEIHHRIAQMGCSRHEVHPMYASSFAENLALLTLDEIRDAADHLLEMRDPNLWILFGTLPFFACSPQVKDRQLVERLRRTPNVTVRNDPDGRNRLNVDVFNGDVYVTDFASVPPLGNMKKDRLNEVFDRWLQHPLSSTVNCYCPEADCCGPNLLVTDSYYSDVDFKKRRAIIG